MKQLNFYIDEQNGAWYADIPEYPGPKEDLQMVLGADDMLNDLAEGKLNLTIGFDTQRLRCTGCAILKKLIIPSSFDGGSGQWYAQEYNHRTLRAIWLCDVTKFVFGHFPDIIYFKVI